MSSFAVLGVLTVRGVPAVLDVREGFLMRRGAGAVFRSFVSVVAFASVSFVTLVSLVTLVTFVSLVTFVGFFSGMSIL
jgi:hypothetical protein